MRFSVEPDSAVWRLRFHCVDGYREQIIEEPTDLIWALDTLQLTLWGDHYHTVTNRERRFTRCSSATPQVISVSVLHAVNGDVLQFDIEPLVPAPPTIDALGMTAKQLIDLRTRLAQKQGIVLLTGTEPQRLHNTYLAINQELISPENQVLSISTRHRYSLPRTNQVEITSAKPKKRNRAWQHALDSHHNTLLIDGPVPNRFHELIAERCDSGILTIQSLHTIRPTHLLNDLNAGILKRTPLQRAVTTVVTAYSMLSICDNCATTAHLDDTTLQWLDKLRTPASENVIDWLTDGNTEQFMYGEGCDACADTGVAAPLMIYDIVHRNSKTNLFPITYSERPNQGLTLQRQLMTLAKAGKIPLSEVIRILQQSTSE